MHLILAQHFSQNRLRDLYFEIFKGFQTHWNRQKSFQAPFLSQQRCTFDSSRMKVDFLCGFSGFSGFILIIVSKICNKPHVVYTKFCQMSKIFSSRQDTPPPTDKESI